MLPLMLPLALPVVLLAAAPPAAPEKKADPAPAAAAPAPPAAPAPDAAPEGTAEGSSAPAASAIAVSPPPPAPPPPAPRAPAPPRRPPRAPERPALPRGHHEHDGFYLRIGFGFSGFSESLVPRSMQDQTDYQASRIDGFATASELAIGGTPTRGVVIGGGFYRAGVLTSGVKQGDPPPVPTELRRPTDFSIIGGLVDWYLKPRAGTHIQVAVGVATLATFEPNRARIRDGAFAVGGGLMAGIGNEWWVGDDWGIGVLGRITAGIVTDKDDGGARWFHAVAAAPSVLFSATYH